MAENPVVGAVFGDTFSSLERAMKIATLRQEVISQNIANANTKGYEALAFNEELMRAEKRIYHPKVAIEREMTELANNQVAYAAAVKLMSAELNKMRTIATQGRR